MRIPRDSPFTPGSDTVPSVWAGRSEYLNDWRDIVKPRRLSGYPESGRTVVGEPGTGKSALVRKIAQEARAEGDWVTPQLRIPLDADPLKLLAGGLMDLAKEAGIGPKKSERILKLLGHVEAMSIQGVSVSMRGKGAVDPYLSLRDLLIEIGREARQRRKMVLVHLDEVHNITDAAVRSQVLIALGDALTYQELIDLDDGGHDEMALPIAVYLTGLPEFVEMTGASSGATFARRFLTSTLSTIDDGDFVTALRPFLGAGWSTPTLRGGAEGRVRMQSAARDQILSVACGEPYLFQLVGHAAWTAGDGDEITEDDVLRGWELVKGQAELHVVRMLERLPPKEMNFLEVMARLPAEERSATNIARAMGFDTARQIGTSARRLDLERGVIKRGKPYLFSSRAVEAYLTETWPFTHP